MDGLERIFNMMSESFGKFIVIAELGKKEAAAKKVVATAGDILEVLQDLLRDEYLQRDIYESYRYILFGADGISIMEHLEEHMAEEMKHADILQRYIVSLGGVPTIERHAIPMVEKGNLKGLLRLNLKHEKSAVQKYGIALRAIEAIGNILHAALINDLEDIVSQEQEHVHDIERWLKWKKLY